MPTAAIIGAGPVGCLTAVGLHQRGYDVTLYEIRPEAAFENTQSNARSINLAISTRGLTALSSVDAVLTEIVLQNSVPMRARMIHSNTPSGGTSKEGAGADKDGLVRLDSQRYSDRGQCIHSVSRNLLNRLLLDEVLKCGIQVCWSHKLLSANMHTRAGTAGGGAREHQVELTFDNKESKGLTFWTDLIVGCDGHHSKVRSELSRSTELDFAQHYIDNYYSELHIPAIESNTGDKEFALDPNHLHIWPRHDFMLIALPNQDKSFTSTLFAPRQIFKDHLTDEHRLLHFFQKEFPDALKMIGRSRLVKDLLGVKPSSLGSVECNPYHFKGRLILLGDASHAMVPFYGQGLNCGLEDVRIMLELLDKHQYLNKRALQEKELVQAGEGERVLALIRERAFDEYSSTRHVDLLAISQLALDNFHEMSSKVVSTSFRIRKQIDSLLVTYLPDQWWDSLYTLVTFSNIGYHTAQRREAKQKRILDVVGASALASLSVAAALFVYRATKSLA
jgi:kynurenine 3-monooxygenase